jgi:hypothetical protein
MQEEIEPEKILGVIDNAQFPAEENKPVYSLVFTSERVIATLLAAESESLLRLAVIDGIDGIGHLPDPRFRFKNMVKNVADESHRLLSVDPITILSTHKGSFALPYSQIRRIKLKRGGFMSRPYIKLYTYEKKYLFMLLRNLGKSINKQVFLDYTNILESTGIRELY